MRFDIQMKSVITKKMSKGTCCSFDDVLLINGVHKTWDNLTKMHTMSASAKIRTCIVP
jgi:hypothetical protein